MTLSHRIITVRFARVQVSCDTCTSTIPRAKRDGSPFDNQRFTERPDYRRACTHSEQQHNRTCTWCGADITDDSKGEEQAA